MAHGDAPSTAGRIATLLEAGLDELGLAASDEQRDALVGFTRSVARWGEGLNLTGHREPEAIARHLVLGAAALSTALPELASINDLGSGAGFPGVPLAILRPGCRVHLVEARERRYHFLRDVVRSLNLPTLSVERGRVETLDPSPRSCAIAQALGPAAKVVEWLLPWAQEGGWLAIPGSPHTAVPGEDSRFAPALVRDYAIPLGGPPRRLWLARRTPGSRT